MSFQKKIKTTAPLLATKNMFEIREEKLLPVEQAQIFNNFMAHLLFIVHMARCDVHMVFVFLQLR